MKKTSEEDVPLEKTRQSPQKISTEDVVSIIIPTFQSAKTLAACLESVTCQTYQAIEIIVIDNYSQDETCTIAKKYAQKVYVQGPERCAQRNYGVSKAGGKYVAIIDSDMELEPRVVEECVSLMESSQEFSGVIIPEESFGKGFWAQCKKLERSFYVGVPWMEASRFFLKETYLEIGGYDEKMVSGEDWDLSQRVQKKGKIGRISSFIYHNEGQMSLWRTICKKFYYAQKFAAYVEKNGKEEVTGQQTSLWKRYTLFLTQPKKLWRQPILGFGMLFMKMCEFLFGGIGYVLIKLKKQHE